MRPPPSSPDGGTADLADAGRPTDPPPPPGPGSGPPPSADECTKIDFVFVVDDSGSMGEEQDNLAANFPLFIEAVEAFRTDDGLPLDYRIAVTTTGKPFTTTIEFTGFPLPPMTTMDDGPNGAFRQDCGMARRWIETGDTDVPGTFACNAAVGTSGSATEMPLQMLARSLTDRVADGTNAGFLREDALLAVIILSDEDDCSRTADSATITLDPATALGSAVDECDPMSDGLDPIPNIISTIDAVKGDRGRWAVAVIAGPGPGTCMSDFGQAVEGVRLQSFVDQVGPNAVFSSICEGDLAGALTTALDTFDTACQSFPPLI